MKLRFIFLTALLATLMARGAVPSYNGTTLVVSPTNLHRSNFLDSATLTWTKDQFGRMTPNVIGGNSSNAQPPSVNLTNWSNVDTQALRIAKTLYVTTNGTDATAAREWTHLQFRTPGHAKTNAQAGDTIVVWPGTYLIDTNLNLAKTEVNWHAHNGAEIIRDGGGNPADSHKGIFYDIGAGAMQFTVSGYGTFIVSNGYSLALNFTNRSSRVVAVGKRWQNKSNGPLIYHGESDLTVHGYETARADLYDLVWSAPSDGVASRGSLYVDAPYVYAGDNLVETKSFATNGACVISARYAESQTLNSGQTLLAGSNVTVRFDVMRTTGIITTTGTAQPPEYNIGYLEIVGNPDVPPISIGVWLRNSFVYSPGTTIPIRASAGVGGPVLLQDVSIHTGAPTWVEGFGGAGGYVTNLGTFTVNSGKLPDSNVRVISHLSPGLGFSITNQIGALTLHETNGTFAVGLRAAENLTNNFTLILPTNHPAVGQVLSVRAVSGQNYSLTWSNDGGGALGSSVSVSSNGVQVVAVATNLNFINFGLFTNSNGNVDLVPVSAAQQDTPYILYTNGSGTNTTFYGWVQVNGPQTNTQPIRVMADQDSTNVFGRGGLFTPSSSTDNAYFAHVDRMSATDFSVRQLASGDTDINAVSGRLIGFSNGGTPQWYIDGSGDFIAATDDTDYIGLVGANRPKGINVGTHGITNAGPYVGSGIIRNVPRTLAYSGTTNVIVDCSLGNFFNLTMTNNAKLWPTNVQAGATYIVNLLQDGTGSRLLYWDSGNMATNAVHVLSTAANAKDVLYWSADNTGTNVNSVLHIGFQK